MRCIAGLSRTEKSVKSSPERRTISSATIESLPPPTGTSTRSSVCGAAVRASPSRGNTGRGSAGSALTTANSPSPSEYSASRKSAAAGPGCAPSHTTVGGAAVL